MQRVLYQALANSFNLEYCRAHKFQNSGLLIWQYNDIWPCVSWSMVDWYGTPKPSYYFQKRAARPLHIAADYERYLWKSGEKFGADIYAMNDEQTPLAGASYTAKLFDIGSNVLTTASGKVSVAENSSVKVGRIEYTLPKSMAGKSFFVSVELTGSDGKEISDALYPVAVSKSGDVVDYRDIFADMNPMPEATLKEARGSHQVVGGTRHTLTVNVTNTSEKIAYFVRLSLEGESPAYRASYSDNYISLLPGETKSIDVTVEGAAPESGGGMTFVVGGWNAPRSSFTVAR